MEIDLKSISSFLASGTIFSVIIIFIGKTFFNNWLDSKFKQRLRNIEHENNLVIENHKLELNKEYNKLTHLHNKEYEVLPSAWCLLQDCIFKIQILTSRLKSNPDLKNLEETDLDEVLNNYEWLNDAKKKNLKSSSDRNECFRKYKFYHELNTSGQAFDDFICYVLTNSIFMRKELKDKFEEIEKEIKSVWYNMETRKECRDFRMLTQAWRDVENRIIPKRNEIEGLIRSILSSV